jgi:glycolate oxidase iron-sulfur subunit
MRGLADGKISPTAAVVKHLDLCLDCRACETACPSGVVYHELIEHTRANLKPTSWISRVLPNLLIRPWVLRMGVISAQLFNGSGLTAKLPSRLRRMLRMFPRNTPLWPGALPKFSKATNTKKTVAFFAGCAGSVLNDSVNRKSIDLLVAAGADVKIVSDAGCCGAIHHHSGLHEPAIAMARKNIENLLNTADFIVTPIAGCGSMLKQYAEIMKDEKAVEFSKKVRDINEILVELGLPKMPNAIPATAAYADACHLAHAQKITDAPRKLLSQIPGLILKELPESDICCGAAGIYNITHGEMSSGLAQRKLENFAKTGAKILITSNIGCAMHLGAQAAEDGMDIQIVHPVELLHRAAGL